MFKHLKNVILNNSIYQKVLSSKKATELFTSSFWSIAGALLSKGTLFLAWVLVARILGSEGYGQFGIIRSTVLMFASFAGFSLGITASKHVAEYLDRDIVKTGRILGLTLTFGAAMGLLVGIVFYVASPWLATNTLNAPELIPELRITALILFFSSLNGAQMGALQGFMAFKLIARINIIQALISFPLFILGAMYLGVNGTVWAFTISYVLICILSYITLDREIKKYNVKINYKESFYEKNILFTYSLPAFLGGLLVSPVKWYSESLLVLKSGFSEMGLFTAALTFNNIILVGAGMLSAPFIAIMARNKGDDRNSKFSRFNILAPWGIGVFVCAPFLVFPNLGSLIFGKSFSGPSFESTFVLVLLFTVIVMFKQGLARVMVVHDLQWLSFFSNVFWGISLLGAFLLFKNASGENLAISYLIAYILNVLVVLPAYYRKKIIPRKTIETYEAFSIWGIVACMALVGLNLESIALRGIILILSLFMLFILFKKIFNKRIV